MRRFSIKGAQSKSLSRLQPRLSINLSMPFLQTDNPTADLLPFYLAVYAEAAEVEKSPVAKQFNCAQRGTSLPFVRRVLSHLAISLPSNLIYPLFPALLPLPSFLTDAPSPLSLAQPTPTRSRSCLRCCSDSFSTVSPTPSCQLPSALHGSSVDSSTRTAT